MAEPNAANVISGPAVIYVAPAATAFPSFASLPAASAWTGAGFVAVGYTDTGVDITDTPSVKEIVPDEVISPVKQIVTGLKTEIKFTLLEATLENISKAIALASLNNPGTGIKTLSVGSGNPLQEFTLGLVGPGIGGSGQRVLAVNRVNSLAAVQQNYTRKDVTKVAVTFTALADSTKASTADVYQVVDFGAGS
jgi:hypothetical protein